VPASSAIDVKTFSRYFEEKVAKVRSGTSDAPPPTFRQGRPDVSLHRFLPLTTDDVINGIDQAIQLKPPSCEYFPTYYRLSTAVIQLR